MTATCPKGHERTAENTRQYDRKDRPGVKLVCLVCKREDSRERRGGLKGTNPLVERSQALTQGRLEDVEDLLGFGSTFQEVVTRSGYTRPGCLYHALRRAGKHDVLERLRSIRQ